MFRTVPLSIIGSFSPYTQQWYMSYSYADCLLASCQQTCMTYTIAACTVKNSRRRTCPKHVEFYSKNKFEKLVHLVGFILRIYHDARSHERQKYFYRCLFATHKLLDCTDRRIPLFPSVTSLQDTFPAIFYNPTAFHLCCLT